MNLLVQETIFAKIGKPMTGEAVIFYRLEALKKPSIFLNNGKRMGVMLGSKVVSRFNGTSKVQLFNCRFK